MTAPSGAGSAPLDVLAVAAHPDDVELACGGTLVRVTRLGMRAGILDLTRGELGSRGSAELRAGEAAAAGAILGLAERRNAALPDGGLDPFDPAQRLAVVRQLRELRPRLVLLPWGEARHPDHAHASRLGEEACFRSGLHRLETGEPPFRPNLVLYYMERFPFEPTLVVDVSAEHETKMRAIHAYASQFDAAEGNGEPATFLTRPGFLAGIVARDRHYGEMVGLQFGEPLRARGPLPVGDALRWLVGNPA